MFHRRKVARLGEVRNRPATVFVGRPRSFGEWPGSLARGSPAAPHTRGVRDGVGFGMVALLTTACGPLYTPGTITASPGTRMDAGMETECLDVAIEGIDDTIVPEHWPVIAYRIGNRCRHPIAIDFTRFEAHGEIDGLRVPLEAYDPDSRIVRGLLDGRALLLERIAYVPDEERFIDRVCVVVSSDAPTRRAPLCVQPRPAPRQLEERQWDVPAEPSS